MIAELQNNEIVNGMPSSYVHNSLGGVFNAGFSTLFAATGSISLLLLGRPDLLEALRDEELLKTGVHELLRITSPAQATSRFAIEDVVLSGVTIPAGSTVVTLMAAANRDSRVFHHPDEIILDRNPNPHLAFAWGPHVCLGSQLATVWIQELICFLHQLGDTFQLRGDPTFMDTATLRNLTNLPVAFVSPPTKGNTN